MKYSCDLERTKIPGSRNDKTSCRVLNYLCKADGGAVMLDGDARPVVTDLAPLRMDNRSMLFGGILFSGGGKSNVGDNAGAEAGTCCPWGGYKLCGITCGREPRTGMECWRT